MAGWIKVASSKDILGVQDLKKLITQDAKIAFINLNDNLLEIALLPGVVAMEGESRDLGEA